MNTLPKLVVNLALNRLLAEFEVPPLRRIRLSKPANKGVVTQALRGASTNSVVRFITPKSRSALLSAVRDHMAKLEGHEEVLVGLGRRLGSGARFDGFWMNEGTRDSVGFTALGLDLIEKQLRVSGAEIIVVHNHPPNDLKAFLGLLFRWRPLPSSADREVALNANLRTWVRFWDAGLGPRFRWYLVDEGEVAEFYLPSVERLLAVAHSVLDTARC